MWQRWNLSDLWRTACHSAGCRAGRLYHYDVWYYCSQRNPDDRKLRLYPEEYHHCRTISQHRNRIYTGTGDLSYLPAGRGKCLCGKLCCRGVPGGDPVESGIAREYGDDRVRTSSEISCLAY